MPISRSFKNRLYPALEQIIENFATPFHIYDETGINETGKRLKKAFAPIHTFREYFAVKALPNPTILKIVKDLGFGFDCSSTAELQLSRGIGAGPDDIMFTSNNTSYDEFIEAEKDGGCILNLDDINLLGKLPRIPELICFRYNPGEKRDGNDIIGKPVESKYGVSHDQIIDAYQQAKMRGSTRFGIHTMLASNERDHRYMVQTTRMLLECISTISQKLDITFDFVNIGGGLGIPYHPNETELDIEAMGEEICSLFKEFKEKNNYEPALYMESGRYITGPHGVLVVTAINRKDIYRTYIGVDASMSALMRPGIYGAYHHIDVLGKENESKEEIVDVVGSLCENNDKFAIQRNLPKIQDGDILIIQDTGAHGSAMGFNYNGSLRPKELLFKKNNGVELIRRAEQVSDYFATLEFQKKLLTL